MSEEYPKSLVSRSREFRKKNPEILDIIIYGSSATGKSNPRDIDIMLLFKDVQLGKRLTYAQEFKTAIRGEFPGADVKTMNLMDLFDRNFLARQGILLSGVSLITKERMCEKLGFRAYAIFSYNLKGMDHNQKTKFNYALNGRLAEGVLKSLKGISLGRGSVKIPVESGSEFEEFLEGWKVRYKKEHVLEAFY
jgi:predicted nucleotidyltransferase